jgi:recombination protein RecA
MLTKASELDDITVIPTGLFIDKLTGVGGIARGHITEVFGDPGIGKSSLCLQIVGAAQKRGNTCVWADVEWGYTPRYAKELGVKNEDLYLIRDQYAEASLQEVEELIEKGNIDLIVIDSIGGLTPRAEQEKGIDAKTIGAQAGLVARFCRKVVPLLAMNNVALVVINHSFVDIMSGKIQTSGGKKLGYHKAVSIRLKQKTGVVLKSGDRQVGKVVVAQVWGKNRLAATEGMELDAQFIFGQGFSSTADLFQDAVDKGVITKEGQSFVFRSEKIGRGANAAREAVMASPELQAQIKEAVDKLLAS